MLPVCNDDTPDYAYMENYMKSMEKKILQRYANYLSLHYDSKLTTIDLQKKQNKPFKMKDILNITPCRFTGKGVTEKGKIPYVGATNRNNGVLSFLDIKNEKIIKGNCIVFICNGDGSIGLSVYRETDFVGSVDVKIGRSEHLNRYVGTYLTTVADSVRPHYSFGYKRTLSRLMNESLLLPTNSDGTPDYVYMENYMRKEENKILKRYIDTRLTNL